MEGIRDGMRWRREGMEGGGGEKGWNEMEERRDGMRWRREGME